MTNQIGNLSRNLKLGICLGFSALLSPFFLIPIGLDGWNGFLISIFLLFSSGGFLILDILESV